MVGTLHWTSSTVHGACLTLVLCFWVDERPDGSDFSMTWMTMTKSHLFESAQPFTSVFTTKYSVNILSCIHYKKQS